MMNLILELLRAVVPNKIPIYNRQLFCMSPQERGEEEEEAGKKVLSHKTNTQKDLILNSSRSRSKSQQQDWEKRGSSIHTRKGKKCEKILRRKTATERVALTGVFFSGRPERENEFGEKIILDIGKSIFGA